MITVKKENITKENYDIMTTVPEWKVILSKQLYQSIKLEYSSEIHSKFDNIKSVNVLCKKISKSVLNSVYEEDILESIALILNIYNILDASDEIKLKVCKKLKKYFLHEEMEFLRDEVMDSMSRLKKEWLNI